MNQALPTVFALTLFLASALLFSVQPMIARTVLPLLGGSPSVWTTCMLFFQSALLAGYGYAHATTSWLGTRRQVVLHGLLLASAYLFLPLGAPAVLGVESHPTVGLLGWLTRSAGLPFFAVATTAPLLQRWFAASGHTRARDPYFLYAASNAGSLAALIAYPLWIERRLGLGAQSVAWSAGFTMLVLLVAGCAAVTLVHVRGKDAEDERVDDPPTALRQSSWPGWIILALIPSSLMLGVTTYLTTDLAPIPLLWVVPLALYLLSFIVVFSRRSEWFVRASRRMLPILLMAQAPVMGAGLVQPFWIPLHLFTFFSAAVVCHGELARRRPSADRLTSFYLAMAVGGALGGLFNAIVAPVVFEGIAEYPLALVAACLVLAFRGESRVRETLNRADLILPVVVGSIAAVLCANVGGVADSALGVLGTMAAAGLTVLVAAGHRRHPSRFALTVGSLSLACALSSGVTGRVIHQERSFFGVLKVTALAEGKVHRLFHGSTLHGQQSFEPGRRCEPLTYFARSGPVGQVFEVFDKRSGHEKARVAVTGVGAGSIACYARPGQSWTYYEIDPAVVRIARDPRYFTHLNDCLASTLSVLVGDARIRMASAVDGGYDLVILDAFSSDAIPIHLLNREALALYRRKLADGGLIAVNISNRYLDLAPVIARLARDAGLVARVRVDARISAAQKAAGKQGSIWAVLAVRESDMGDLANDPRWFIPRESPDDRVWTDDFSNVFDHYHIGSQRVRATVD
jgi:hypothetical protein